MAVELEPRFRDRHARHFEDVRDGRQHVDLRFASGDRLRLHVDAISDLPDTDRPIGTRPVSAPFLQRLSDVVANHGLLALGVLYLAGLAVMTIRIAWGFAAVRGYRRDSSLLTDQRLLEFVDVVRAREPGCTRQIEVRVSARSRTPATIGWRKPVLLLPLDWRAWTDDECLAVLAHEIEHVRRGDFAAWVAAQFGVALHFYHPLVHWLAAHACGSSKSWQPTRRPLGWSADNANM